MKIDETNCPVRATMQIIGGKWKPIILYYIKTERVCRFSELERYIPHITKKMLTQQLRELESDGIVNRKSYPQYGKSLKPILQLMADWGLAHRARRI